MGKSRKLVFLKLHVFRESPFAHIAKMCIYICSKMRPLPDCLVKKLMPLGEKLCPNMDIDTEITKITDAFRRLLPMFLPQQLTLKEMLLNPLPVVCSVIIYSRFKRALMSGYMLCGLDVDGLVVYS